MATRNYLSLDKGWKWRLASSNGVAKAEEIVSIKDWTPTQAFPSVIHTELLANKLIPDPNVGENERYIQWVGEAAWEYSCSFSTPEGMGDLSAVDLVLEGLDTFATVKLNGKEILHSDNMFIPHRLDVKNGLNPAGQENVLSIVFESAVKKGDELEKMFGARTSPMRDKRRMHMRKVQSHWGWDWGPRIITAGPYMPIYLDIHNARVDNVYVTSDLASDHSSADIAVTIKAVGKGVKTADVRILDQRGSEISTCEVGMDSLDSDTTSYTGQTNMSISSPKLWWPNGQGNQHLYTVQVTLRDQSRAPLDTKSLRMGVRTIKIIQRPLDNAPGTTFLFNVNGRDIYSQGGNWIPADTCLPTITRERYFDWVRLAKYNHLNMIRVWGGGIYETDDFMDACDELGMLVWHDYAFACGDYPIHDAFLKSIKLEVEIQTVRLRNRASLALLCGGNEDFMIKDRQGYDFSDLRGPFEETTFPQRKIYLQLLPEVAKRLAPQITYWGNSPYGAGGKDASDPTVGDIHQWNVWHGRQAPYQKYKTLSGRFVSEFGMHGFPIMRTVDVFVPPDSTDRYPQSRAVDCHNKGRGAEVRIARYLAENFRYDNTSLENFVYASHLLQSEAYGCSLRDWKRLFGGKGKEECAGAIIWQLNDVYPSTSWAYVDYYLRPKPAFYTIRRAFAPLSVGVERTPSSRFIDDDDDDIQARPPKFSVYAHNTTPTAVDCTLVLRAYDFHTATWIELDASDKLRDVSLNAGCNTELGTLEPQSSWTRDSLIVLQASLVEKNNQEVLSNIVDWPEPFRYLRWPKDTKVETTVADSPPHGAAVADDGVPFEHWVTVRANHPIKGCWLEAVYDGNETEDEPEPLWEDNMLDLMPAEKITVGVKGLRGRQIKVRFLGDWELGP
ncbi:glycoside hydrolase superfamily [Aspergillus oleicola]